MKISRILMLAASLSLNHFVIALAAEQPKVKDATRLAELHLVADEYYFEPAFLRGTPGQKLKLEIETGLFNQLGRHIPPSCTAHLDDYKGRRNWLVRIIDPEGKQIGYVWFGTNADNNWAYDGLVRVGDDRYVVWQVFQRYSDGSYRRIRMQAPRLQRVVVDSSS